MNDKISDLLNRVLDRDIREFRLESKGFQNIVATFKVDENQYVARLSDKKKEWVEAEIKWLDYLQDKGIRLAAPVRFNELEKVIEITRSRKVFAYFFPTYLWPAGKCFGKY